VNDLFFLKICRVILSFSAFLSFLEFASALSGEKYNNSKEKKICFSNDPKIDIIGRIEMQMLACKVVVNFKYNALL